MNRSIQKNIIKILISAILLAAVFYIVCHFFIRPTYTANTVLRIESSQEEEPGFFADKQRLSTYNEILNSSKIKDQILTNLGIDFSASEFGNKVKIKGLGNSELFEMTSNDTIAERSMDLANESSEIFQKEINAFIDDKVEIVDEATLPKEPVMWMKVGCTLLGFLLGLIIGAISMIRKVRNDDSFHTIESLTKRFDYPVLGEIPQMNKKNSESREVNEIFKEEEDGQTVEE